MSAKFLPITPRWSISFDELEIRAVRSSGPGGQNVNKVASKITLRYNIVNSKSMNESLSPGDRSWLMGRIANKLTTEGDLIISSDEHRDQPMNKDAALERLVMFLRAALKRPKARTATRPTLGSKKRRLEGKKRRGDIKKMRQSGDSD